MYAKCAREGDSRSILLSTDKIKVDSDAAYYHFLVGVLNTPLDVVRSWQPSFGYTEISGNQITTGVIKDYLSRLVIDLVNGTIYGKIEFASGSSGYDNITDKPDLSAYDEALNYIDNVLPDDLARLQNQIDDAIESWFYHYDPTMSNVPASGWTTGALKEAHLDDTFTNLDSGQSWRFTRSGTAGSYVYSWTLLADTAASQALVLAGQAKDTADGKRTTFLHVPPARPVPPYDVGDIWFQGASGDILVCVYKRSSGTGVLSDWEKSHKYIDESTASGLAAAASSSGMATARNDIAQKLGYSDYAAMVTAATQGKTIIDGGYVRTALIDAAAIVTSTLVAQRLTAAMIEALDITTSKLTVTSGAKIGNFTIENGWLKSNATLGSDVGYIDMRSPSTRVAFGTNLVPSTAGGGFSCTAVIKNETTLSGLDTVSYGLHSRAKGVINETSYQAWVKNVAVFCDGGLQVRGGVSMVEEMLYNTDISNSSFSSASVLKYHRMFVFQGAGTSSQWDRINLPSSAAIEAAFGYLASGANVGYQAVIRLYILVTRHSTSSFQLCASSTTPLVRHNGEINTYNTSPTASGWFMLNACDCVCVTYFNGAWYLSGMTNG